MDTLLEARDSRWMKLALVRDLVVADVLYHELGHHVHRTPAPEFREREDVAEDWRKRFNAYYFRQYRWLTLLRPILSPVIYLSEWWHGGRRETLHLGR